MPQEYTRLRPHWRPTHDATPRRLDEWVGGDGPNGWVKILNPDGHHVRGVFQQAPQSTILLRNHSISEQKAEMLADPEGTARRHAEFWNDWLYDQGLYPDSHRFVCEGINEASIWEPGVLDATVRYNAEFVSQMRLKGLMPGALQLNTGWPTNHNIKDGPPDWQPFEPLRRILLEAGGYLCLHEYWDSRGPRSTDWGWNPGRFTQLPDRWRGIPILITECGYDRVVNAPHGTPHAGYLDDLDQDRYMAQLVAYDEEVRASGWDVRACFAFTHDFDHPWSSFDTMPLLGRLVSHAQAVRQLPTEPTAPQALQTTHLPSVSKGKNVSVDESWQRAIAWLLREEGGYQNHSWDPGNYTPDGVQKGTNFGISARSYPHLDIINLTEVQARRIFYEDYWLASRANELAWPLCLAVFDTAVLHGVGTALDWAADSPSLASFLAKRLGSYTKLPHWDQAGAGWVNRVTKLLVELGESL